MSVPIPIISGLISIGDKVIDKWFPDPNEAEKRKLEFASLISSDNNKELEHISSIIKAEANSGHFITASWRPITMLVFVMLIAAHWLGFTPDNLTEKEVLGLLDIVKVGLGGYVIGRTAEKSIEAWKK